jgi:hypothetical protein
MIARRALGIGFPSYARASDQMTKRWQWSTLNERPREPSILTNDHLRPDDNFRRFAGSAELGNPPDETGFDAVRVDKGPDSVDNRDPLWTGGHVWARRRRRNVDDSRRTSKVVAGPSGCPPRRPPRPPIRAGVVHGMARVVHRHRQHADEEASTASTP